MRSPIQIIREYFQPKPAKANTRSMSELISIGGQNSDWLAQWISEDAEMLQNSWGLTSRVRDLFRCNPLYQAYRETVWSNVLGADGTMLRCKIKETEDRVIHTADEERAIRAYDERRNRVMEWLESKTGRNFKRRQMLRVFGDGENRKATVKVGDPDIYANLLIERAWKEWSRKEFCDSRGSRNYQTIRQLRLISAIRDGDFFIRMIKDSSKNPDGSFRLNKFGFALQLVNAEWVDRFCNVTLDNGNVIRMGIEYTMNSWGIGKPVAYHFIKRMPRDWLTGGWRGGSFPYGGRETHDRIPADQIIHYARATDADGTRPAPWVASTIPSSRQRDQAMLAETIAWRASACKMGWLSSTVAPEGGYLEAGGKVPEPNKITGLTMEAGAILGLPNGVEFTESNPTHPNANVEEFRKASLRDGCAGMPGADYSTLANDYEAINFSAGRLQRLDTNDKNKILQVFDIDYAEIPTYEAFLEMGLITGAIPLPLAKFDKFNQKMFSGRRWAGVDELKEINAAAARIANKLSSRTRECADKGLDFEEVLMELAEEEMSLEQFGMSPTTTAENPALPPKEDSDEDEPPAATAKKPKKPDDAPDVAAGKSTLHIATAA